MQGATEDPAFSADRVAILVELVSTPATTPPIYRRWEVHEIDFLKAGEKENADAITMRFTRPDTGGFAHVVIDAGWQEDGQTVVDFVRERYGVETVDLVIVSHPDGDHIGGMGTVFRELAVGELLIHRLDQRGGAGLPAAKAVGELVQLAEARGAVINEPFQGLERFGGALTILGPDEPYYNALAQEQQAQAEGRGARLGAAIAEAARRLADRVLEALPVEEVPFDDGPGCGPRNNSSVITFLQLDALRALLTADAGVPAVERALDYGVAAGLDVLAPDLIQIPHHGSRRNASSVLLNRALGPIGEPETRSAYVSVATENDPKHPAGRVVNAYKRRGYQWNWTAGNSIYRHSPDAPPRSDYWPLSPMPALEELPDADT
jgi:beta-lactamase superfamily II metal-dependent hydrolase